jgi:hypothetical protein
VPFWTALKNQKIYKSKKNSGPMAKKEGIEFDFVEKKDGKFLDKPLEIQLNPRKLLSGFFLLLLFTSVFFAGRWSVQPPALQFALGEETELAAEEASAVTAAAVVEPVAEVVQEPSEAVVPEPSEAVVHEPSEAEVVPEPSEKASDEKIITDYKRVAFSIDKAKIDWKETWGKITHLEITIKNNEEGTILPHHVTFEVEGYDNFFKEVPLSQSTKLIKAGETKSGSPAVPFGFGYSEASAGDLTSVQIKGILYDAQNKPMTSFNKNFDLTK